MKSSKKIIAALLAVMHILTYSANAQVININEGTTAQIDNINVAAGDTLTINVLDQLGQVCPSCRGILETNGLLNNGAIDIWGILAIIAPTIVNNGVITVQGDLLLSNLGINKEQFFAGIAELSKDPALANGYILNTGEIHNLTQGLLAMVAANGGVHNLGTITANGGAVALVAGDKVSFPLTRDGVLNISLEGVTGVKGQVFDKDGNLVDTKGLVTNSGVIQANGGAVVLQAAGAEAVYDSIINHTGIIEAKSIAQENGKIILKSETGDIHVENATIDASGLNAGEKGGSIHLLTKGNIVVDGTTIVNASGDNGGGEILIGGDAHGTGGTTAANVGIGSGVSVKADAVTSGNGGKIVVWSEGTTLAYGSFSARGGALSGNGGFVETSGKEYFDIEGIAVDNSAPNGVTGEWLLDPATLTIADSAVTTNAAPFQLNSFLTDGQITVAETAASNTITWGKIASLAVTTNIILQASGLITINNVTGVAGGAITSNNLVTLGLTTGSLSITSTAGAITFADTNDVIRTNGGALSFTAGGGNLTLGGFNTTNSGGNGAVTLNATGNVSVNTITAGTGSVTINADTDNTGNTTLTANAISGGTVALKAGTTQNNAGNNDTLTLNGDVTGASITIQNAQIVNLAANVDLTTTNGDLAVSSNIGGIVLTGGSGTTNILSTDHGFADLDDITTANAAGNSPNLTVSATRAVTIDSANIKNGALSITVDSNNNSNYTGTFGALTAGSITANGTGGNDNLVFNGAVTTNTGALTSTNSNNITFNNTVTTSTNLAISGSSGVVDFAGSGASTVSGTANISSAGITDSGTGSLTVTGTATLAAGAGNNITLDNTANNFSTVVVTSGNNVSLRDAGAINLGNITTAANFTVNAGSAITDSNGTTISVGSLATFNAGANAITLGDNAGDVTNFGSLNLTGSTVNVTEDSATNLTGVSASSLTLTSNGAITDANGTTINVTGQAQFNAITNAITLGDNAGDTTNFGSLILTGTTVNVTEDSAMVLNGVGATTLNLTANGSITDNSNNVGVTGTTTLNAGANDIILDNANDFGGAVSVTAANNVTLVDANTLPIGTITATGSVNLTATTGAITDTNAASNNITATSLSATAATGIDLDTTITTLTNANVSGTGNIGVRDTAGGLAVTSATTNNGNITISATGGNLDAATVTASTAGGTGNVNLSTTTSGNVNVGNVTAAGDDITINSAGAIEELTPVDGTADLTSNTMTLNAVNGIGSANQLEIDATTLTNASVSGTGAINLSDTTGGLVVTSATTTDGAITINATGGNLDAVTVTAGGTGKDVNLSTTTSGNIRLGTVTALSDTANINSAGTIGELTNDDAGVQHVDVSAGTINLTAATANKDIGASNSYLDIQPTTLWNATTNGGNIYISCVGTCPMGQIDAGTGTFYYAGNITDGNDSVNGGLWNIRAGGAHLDADNAANGFIGSATNWIETQLANYAGVSGDLGRLVATAGTGGVHMSNDGGAGHPGLQIGGVAPSTITGITSAGNIEIYSFSPLNIAANVLATGGANILLTAMGHTAADDISVNANVTAQGGNGTVSLIAGDSINVNGTSVVSAAGTGMVSVLSGEDFTDLDTTNHNGTATGSVVMSSGSALRSQDGDILVDANGSARVSEVNANSNGGASGNVTMHARSGFISDTNGTTNNITANQLTMDAVQGIGDGANGDSDILETNITILDALNSGTGAIRVDEVTAGGALGISRAQQTNASGGGIQIRTGNGNLTVLGGGFPNVGVSSASTNGATTVRLEARGTGANDDLILNNTVTTNASKVELYSSSRDVIVNVGGNITSTTGEIEANATRDIFMADTTVANAGSGIIDFDSGRTTTLSEVVTSSNATDAATINAGNNILGFTGAVVNGSTSGVNITTGASGRATIQALTGVGSSKAITTSIGTLDVQNFISNNVNVTEVASGGDMNILRANQTALTGNMNIFTTNGNLTVLDAVSGGVGTLAIGGATRLWAQGVGDLLVNNTVTSATGKINLDSDNNATFSAAGDVNSATGEIEVDATKNLTMDSGTLFTTLGGTIDMDAGDNVTLGGLLTNSNSVNAVTINSRNGSIIDGGDTFTNIQTGANGGALLTAKAGIGDESTANGGIETQIGRLAARTDTGDIQIFNQGNLTIQDISDNDNTTSLGFAGAGVAPVSGISITDSANANSANDHIFVTNNGNLTVNSQVSNLDGGDVSLYSFGTVGTGDMNINANIESIGANGNMRVVSGGDMNMAAGTNIRTQGDGLTSGTGQVAVGAGYDVSGKTRNPDMSVNSIYNAPSLGLNAGFLAALSTNGAGSLLDTVSDAAANLTMDETSRISTESGNIIADAQNNFTVGRVDADGNAGANGITDGTRGNIYAFARNGSVLDAEGPGEIGNLDFVANSLNVLANGTIGLPTNHIEGDAPFLNTFSFGSQFVDMLGDSQVEMLSASGSIFLTATNNIILGHVSAPSGEAHLKAGNNIASLGDDGIRVTASNLIELIAGNVIGTTSDPIHTHLNATPAQLNLSAGGPGANGVSIAVFSNVSPAAVNMLNNPPGLVLFNSAPIAGQTFSGLAGSQAGLYYKAFVRGLRQYSDVDGNYAADFPGYNNLENLGFTPDIGVNTTGIDQLPIRGVTTAPKVVPLPKPAQPTPVQPKETGNQPVLKSEPTPPAVVSIPAKATPSSEAKTDEGVPQTPSSSN